MGFIAMLSFIPVVFQLMLALFEFFAAPLADLLVGHLSLLMVPVFFISRRS